MKISKLANVNSAGPLMAGIRFLGKAKWAKATAAEIKYADCATDALVIQKQIGGEIMTVSCPFPRSRIGPVNVNGSQVTNWFYHVAVRKGDIVYDRITGSAGLQIDEYKKLFEFGDVLKFE